MDFGQWRNDILGECHVPTVPNGKRKRDVSNHDRAVIRRGGLVSGNQYLQFRPGQRNRFQTHPHQRSRKGSSDYPGGKRYGDGVDRKGHLRTQQRTDGVRVENHGTERTL